MRHITQIKGGKVAVVFEFDNRIKIVHVPYVTKLPCIADDAVFVDVGERITQSCRPYQFQNFVIALVGLSSDVKTAINGGFTDAQEAAGLIIGGLAVLFGILLVKRLLR